MVNMGLGEAVASPMAVSNGLTFRPLLTEEELSSQSAGQEKTGRRTL